MDTKGYSLDKINIKDVEKEKVQFDTGISWHEHMSNINSNDYLYWNLFSIAFEENLNKIRKNNG